MNHKILQIYLKSFPPPSLRNTNQGFILPMMVGLGLIMTLVGLTMIGRSSDSQNVAISEEQSSQSQAAAETGITQVMNFLNNAKNTKVLVTNPLKDWESEYSKVSVCEDWETDLSKYIDGNWIDINGRDQFQVRDYQFQYDPDYDPASPNDLDTIGEGVLTIKGEANYNGNVSTTVIDVTIPVKPVTSKAPGLYVKSADLSNNKVDGDLLLHDCNLTTINKENVLGESTANPLAEFPPLPELPDKGNYEPINPITKKMLKDEEDGILEFPLDENDPKDSNERYHYLIEATNNGDSISLQGGEGTIKIKPGKKVTFYLQGDVSLKGNSVIKHLCEDADGNPIEDCKPTNFQIFGGDGKTPTYEGGTTTQFCLSGDSRVEALIFAPKADVGVNGGGDKNNAGITGTVWANSWNKGCGSNPKKILVTQSANWDELPVPSRRRIDTPTGWQRQEDPDQ